MTDPNAQATLTARAEHVVTAEDLAERLSVGRSLRVKLGLDPTARDVTLGWAVPLRKLREFQDLGHTAVLIVGDFTARIGDPSGKSATRKQLTAEEVRGFADSVLEQFGDILAPDPLEIRYNSEWLEGMDLGALLQLTSRYTVARMLERDDFAIRYAEHRPIAMHELLYPLLQGYDSVAVEADVELGGTDQLFNLLVGRDLQRAYGQPPQIAMTMPLLVGTDGVQKMSQSLGNYIAIRDTPEEMFGKLMSIPDTLVSSYARLAAWMSPEETVELETAAAGGGPEAGTAKRRVAAAVVGAFHGAEAATRAEGSFDARFREHELPDDIPEVNLPVDQGDVLYLPKLLQDLGMATSRNEARRLIAQGGVRIDGHRVTDEEISRAELRGAVLQVGKRRYLRIKDDD